MLKLPLLEGLSDWSGYLAPKDDNPRLLEGLELMSGLLAECAVECAASLPLLRGDD